MTSYQSQIILCRIDDIIIIKGTNIIPQQIEKILLEIEGVKPHYRVIVDRKNNRDTLTLHVAVSDYVFLDEVKHNISILKRLRGVLNRRLGMCVNVKLMERRTLYRKLETSPCIVDMHQL